MYFHTSEEHRNATEREIIDSQLSDQGLRYPFYKWIDGKAKVQKFLEGMTDTPDYSNPLVRKAVAENIAKLHGNAVVSGIRSNLYKSTTGVGRWWNTYQVKTHMGEHYTPTI